MWWKDDDEENGPSASQLNAAELMELRAKIDKLLEFESVKQQGGSNDAVITPEKKLEYNDQSKEVVGEVEFPCGDSTDELPDVPEENFELPQDVYSFLASSSLRSGPFWVAVIVVFCFQIFLLLVLLTNQIDLKSDNPLNLPENVEISVRISQAMLLIIAMFQQDDLLVAIETLNRGVPILVHGKEHFRKMTSLRWSLSCLIRMLTGLLGLFASFVLSIQSDNVFDVVLNVLGVGFVSNIDDIAFELGEKGYFGRFVKRATEDVAEATFHRPKDDIWIRRVMHIVVIVSVLIGTMAGLMWIFYRQDSNFLSVREIHVEFNDDIVSFLGLFSGCYTAIENKQLRELGSRRLFYAQDGFPLGGKFGFCSDFGNGQSGWTFFIGEFRNPCGSYIIRSEDTVTFSVLEAGHKLEWFSGGEDGESIGNIEIDKMTDRLSDCGHAYFESKLDVCPTVQALGSLSLRKLIGTNVTSADAANRVKKVKGRRVLDAAVSHTIYFGESDATPGVFDLVFFAGRRWVWTTTDEVLGLKYAPSLSEVSDYFYSSEVATSSGLFRLLEDLLVNGGNQWVRFMSEPVDADSESPLGLQWYYPLYNNETSTDKADAGSMDYTNVMQKLAFPPADTSRILESESTLACQFCDLLKNPCFFEGECNEQTGVCNCLHGASGALCQDRPLGDSICNPFFNTAEHNYDGGDCCASTCEGPFCGQDDRLDPYITGAPTFNWLDASDTEGMYEITNKDDVWKQEVGDTSIAFGVNVTADLTYQFPPLRYEHCVDPALAVIRMEVLPSEVGSTDLVFDGMTVQCGGTIILKTPIFRVRDYSSPVFLEKIRVPRGGECAFGFQSRGYFRGVSFLAEGNAIPFIQLNQSCSVNAYIPQSSCVWDTFAGSSISVSTVGGCESLSNEANEIRRITVPEFDALGSDPVLDGFCRPDPSQLLERYYVWDILSKGSGELVRASVGHVCDGGWNTDLFSVSCNADRRVRRLALTSGASESYVDSMASDVKHFTQLERLEVQSSGVPFDVLLGAMASVNISDLEIGSNIIPSEIGLVQNLRGLRLTSDVLASLPSSIGMLSNLEDLVSSGASLRSLPPEVGNLTSLINWDVGGNKLSSIPTEIGLLQRLQTFNLERNRITSLPSHMGLMGDLQQLLVKSNKLCTLPSEVGMMSSLRTLDLAENFLISLPSELGKLEKLTSLYVTGNILTEIPSEILALTSLKIYGFVEQQHNTTITNQTMMNETMTTQSQHY